MPFSNKYITHNLIYLSLKFFNSLLSFFDSFTQHIEIQYLVVHFVAEIVPDYKKEKYLFNMAILALYSKAKNMIGIFQKKKRLCEIR